MEKSRFNLAMFIPLASVLIVMAFAGGLGIGFILIHETAAKEWGVIGLGVALTVLVPTFAYLIQQRLERE